MIVDLKPKMKKVKVANIKDHYCDNDPKHLLTVRDKIYSSSKSIDTTTARCSICKARFALTTQNPTYMRCDLGECNFNACRNCVPEFIW